MSDTPTPPPTPRPSGSDPSPPERDFVAEYRKREADQRENASWHRIAGSATEFIGAVGLGAVAGWGIDRWLETGPWGLLIGTFAGFAIGLFILWRTAAGMFK